MNDALELMGDPPPTLGQLAAGYDAYTHWMVSRVKDTSTLIADLEKSGWVPVTPERQPYIVDISVGMLPALTAAGLIKVDAPVFEVGGVKYVVKATLVKADFAATDKPEDLLNVNAALIPKMLGDLLRNGRTHLYSVTVSRVPVYGYLPPTVMVCTRSVKVRST